MELHYKYFLVIDERMRVPGDLREDEIDDDLEIILVPHSTHF